MIIKLESSILERESRIEKLKRYGFFVIAMEENTVVLSNGKYP